MTFALGMGVRGQEAATTTPSAKTSPAQSAARLALQHGQEALKKGDLPGARADFEKAVKLAPNNAEAQSALGWVLAQQGDRDGAVSHLRSAIKAKPAFVDARLTLAMI